jgi:hypothetical protein
VYVPFWSVTPKFELPWPSIEVATFTPGPLRCQLCTELWSLTASEYEPVARLPLGPEIEKPGPTEPLRLCAAPGSATTSVDTTTTPASNSRRTTVPLFTPHEGYRRSCQIGLPGPRSDAREWSVPGSNR